MTFSFIENGRIPIGNRMYVFGTFTNTGASTGGDIETKLRDIDGFTCTIVSNGEVVELGVSPIVDAAFEVAGGRKIIHTSNSQGNVTIITPVGKSGFWSALGV